MNIITGYRAEPHITSAQDRAKNQGAFGVGSYILDVGRMLEAEIISANEIRIRDGVLSHQGCVANIESGAYDTVDISSGSQGMQRIDLIVARYTRDAETNIEDVQIEVIEGTPAASEPTVPSYTGGDIQAGDSPVDMPLYRVNISGITISGCTLVAQKITTQAEADAAIAALSRKFVIETITMSSGIPSIPANGVGDIDINVAKSGYTSKGVLGWNVGGGGPKVGAVYVRPIGTSTIRMRLINTDSASKTLSDINVTVLYQKN